MRFFPFVIADAEDMSQPVIYSKGTNLSVGTNISIQANWTGIPTGTFKIQISNDIVDENTARNQDPASNVVNWSDYTGSDTQVVGVAGNWLWMDKNVGYRWIRLVYTRISGSGFMTAIFNGKGN